jgi:excinuclease ABC subunit C
VSEQTSENAGPPPAFDAKEFVRNLPHLPGVYRMLGGEGQVLYVGKARDLKARVSSYFQNSSGLSPRIALMVAQVRAMETTVTRTEAEALLLENNLIKALSPRYNILFRDDKSYPYLKVTSDEFPRIAFFRGTPDRNARYFGPYPNAWAVREAMQMLQKVFRLRTCEPSVFNNRSRPCLLHQIRRCTAPCVGLIGADAYGNDVKHALLFLQGKQSEVLASLNTRMQTEAEALRFEAAAQIRDQIQSLRRMQDRQFVATTGGDGDADIVAAVRAQGVACVTLAMVRAGNHLGDRSFFPQNADDTSMAEVAEAFIIQHYASETNRPPPLVLVNQMLDFEALQEYLAVRSGSRVRVIRDTVGERRVWVEMAERNAELAIGQRVSQRATQESRLSALQESFGLPESAQRIECFDISHTMGEATVASCVVYDGFDMRTLDYRRFNIVGITPGDDYGAMRSALTRRYSKITAEEGTVPDLLLIDGGKGQLAVAKEVLTELGLADILAVGVAKGEERKPGLETLLFSDGRPSVQMPEDHPALHLIQQIRDEAHRFAITGHRARRAKSRKVSVLEEISGIGAKRRQRLLARFGGLKGVEAASIDELCQVEGISRALAEQIYRGLH